jgi:hypothetical protein
MNKKYLLIGSVAIIASVSALLMAPWSKLTSPSAYQSNGFTFLNETKSDDAAEWMKARYIDVTTGQPVTAEVLAQIQQEIGKMKTSKTISFTEQGPDNIGGRTRAIQPDRTNINRVWAGGVSGGLFVSLNKGNVWTRVNEYIAAGANPYISSMTQTPDGTLYVATGSNQEGWNGNGVWYSTDFGLTWASIPGLTNCTEIVSSDADNYVFMATASGLRKWKVGDPSMTTVPAASGGCFALQMSKDGQVIIASFGSSKVFVSTDGGLSFSDKSGTIANNLVPTGAGRIEFAVSAIKNSSNNYSLYAVRTNSNLLSMHVSHDEGQTWYQIVGASGPPNEFDIYRDQGTYNSIVSVKPTDPEHILIGGIDIWKWNQTVNNPPSGGFEKISQWFVNPNSPIYVHADNHEMKWDANNRLYIGNDGGVNVSNDFGEIWYPTNRGYNVTQFYGIAFDRDGAVMGGAQDNGTLYNDHTMSTFQQFTEIGGGDGFECEISYFNPKVIFSSVYYNSIRRSGDKGVTSTAFEPALPGTYADPGTEGSIHPFHTEFVLGEYYDLNSEDSVNFIATKNYETGDIIRVASTSSGDSITVIASSNLYFDDTLAYNPALTVGAMNYGQNVATGELVEMGTDTVIYNVAWDTLRVQDPYQSWFLVYVNINGGELWGTRNALRLSTTFVNWVCVAKGIGAGGFSNVDIEFSKNLEHCYVSAGSGVWRIDGLGSVYSSDPLFNDKVAYVGTGAGATTPTYTTATKITTTSYEGLAINPVNANDIVLFAGFNGVNKRSLNATSAVPTFTSLGAVTSPGVACYDGIIDRDDSDIIVVGTSSGVFVTENGGASWDYSSAGFEGTPVYEVRQSWRTFEEGNNRPGEIYIGTFGRGIWSSAAYLGIGDNNSSSGENFKTKMKTYPNPTNNSTTLSFNLAKSGSVSAQVYSITGRLIKTVVDQNRPAGENTLFIDGDDIPNGTYIIKFVSGKQVESVKFIKM